MATMAWFSKLMVHDMDLRQNHPEIRTWVIWKFQNFYIIESKYVLAPFQNIVLIISTLACLVYTRRPRFFFLTLKDYNLKIRKWINLILYQLTYFTATYSKIHLWWYDKQFSKRFYNRARKIFFLTFDIPIDEKFCKELEYVHIFDSFKSYQCFKSDVFCMVMFKCTRRLVLTMKSSKSQIIK